MLSIFSGYDPRYLTRAVAAGRENYYLSAVAEHGEPPGIWTGAGCPELGLTVGSEVDGPVLERLYEQFIDPRDPGRARTLGRAPSTFSAGREKTDELVARLLAAEPDATSERRDQLIARAQRERRATVYFFDATFSVPKSVSLLHASFQVRAQQARDQGLDQEAEDWDRCARVVWDAVMAGNQAMLDYLQREAGYSRAGYHSRNTGRFVDAHDWVIASFAQHTSRDSDPQLHVHNAILNRVLREDPLASRPGDRVAWRTLDGAGLFAARPAAGAIAERTLAEQLTENLGVEIIARTDGNGWELAGITEEIRDQFSSRRKTIEPRLQEPSPNTESVTERNRTHGPCGPSRNSSPSTPGSRKPIPRHPAKSSSPGGRRSPGRARSRRSARSRTRRSAASTPAPAPGTCPRPARKSTGSCGRQSLTRSVPNPSSPGTS